MSVVTTIALYIYPERAMQLCHFSSVTGIHIYDLISVISHGPGLRVRLRVTNTTTSTMC